MNYFNIYVEKILLFVVSAVTLEIVKTVLDELSWATNRMMSESESVSESDFWTSQ